MSNEDKIPNNKRPNKNFKRRPQAASEAEERLPEKLSLSATNPTHLEAWGERMGLEADKLFHSLGSVFIVNKYPDIPKPKPPTEAFTDRNDPSGFERAMMQDSIKRFGDLNQKLEL